MEQLLNVCLQRMNQFHACPESACQMMVWQSKPSELKILFTNNIVCEAFEAFAVIQSKKTSYTYVCVYFAATHHSFPLTPDWIICSNQSIVYGEIDVFVLVYFGKGEGLIQATIPANTTWWIYELMIKVLDIRSYNHEFEITGIKNDEKGENMDMGKSLSDYKYSVKNDSKIVIYVYAERRATKIPIR
jgi:hypothetical protein